MKRILIAEDEEFNREVLNDMLGLISDNLEITIVHNGMEALEKVKEQTFDIILSDIDMPIMNGYELIEALKKEDVSAVVIAITAYAISGDKEKILMHGFDEYISKPIDLNELQQLLGKYLDA